MSAFFNTENPNQSQADMMEQYMQFCMFQKQQEQHKNTFEQFMKSQDVQNKEKEIEIKKEQQQEEEPLYEKFMKEFKASSSLQKSFIPFDIDNFNGDGLQKAFDLAYQTESSKLSNI